MLNFIIFIAIISFTIYFATLMQKRYDINKEKFIPINNPLKNPNKIPIFNIFVADCPAPILPFIVGLLLTLCLSFLLPSSEKEFVKKENYPLVKIEKDNEKCCKKRKIVYLKNNKYENLIVDKYRFENMNIVQGDSNILKINYYDKNLSLQDYFSLSCENLKNYKIILNNNTYKNIFK